MLRFSVFGADILRLVDENQRRQRLDVARQREVRESLDRRSGRRRARRKGD